MGKASRRKRARAAGRPPQGSGKVNPRPREVGICGCGAPAVIDCPICGFECLRCFITG